MSLKKKDFKVIEGEGVETIIERSNLTNRFAFGDVLNHQKELARMQRELVAQINLTKATCENIERNHEWVKDMDEEKLHHTWMYYENKDLLRKSEEKLTQVTEQIEVYQQLVEMFAKEFNLHEPSQSTEEAEPGSAE